MECGQWSTCTEKCHPRYAEKEKPNLLHARPVISVGKEYSIVKNAVTRVLSLFQPRVRVFISLSAALSSHQHSALVSDDICSQHIMHNLTHLMQHTYRKAQKMQGAVHEVLVTLNPCNGPNQQYPQ